MVSEYLAIQYLGQDIGRYFCTNLSRDTSWSHLKCDGLHQTSPFFLSHSSVRNIYKGKMHSKRISLILQDPLMTNQSVGRWVTSRTGMVWGVMDPSLYHGATQVCTYLRRKLEPTAIMRGGGVIHTGSYHCVPGPLPLSHSCTSIAAPPPPLQGVPRGGNKQQHGAQLKSIYSTTTFQTHRRFRK